MSAKKRAAELSEQAIDDLVVAQADGKANWEKPIQVRKTRYASVSLSGDLVARARFFANLHREADMEAWLGRIIQERLDLEEAAFAELKRDLVMKGKDPRQEA